MNNYLGSPYQNPNAQSFLGEGWGGPTVDQKTQAMGAGSSGYIKIGNAAAQESVGIELEQDDAKWTLQSDYAVEGRPFKLQRTGFGDVLTASSTGQVSIPGSLEVGGSSLDDRVDARIAAKRGLGDGTGVASLGVDGKVPTSQLNLTSVEYQGTWNASTNIPALASGVGAKGNYYVVNVAGSTSIDGISDWKVGDWIIFNGTVWEKADHTDAVVSVAGKQGVVTLDGNDVSYDPTGRKYALGTDVQTAMTQLDDGIKNKTSFNLPPGWSFSVNDDGDPIANNYLWVDGATGITSQAKHTFADSVEMTSTSKAFIPPRVTTAQRKTVPKTTGSIVYNSDLQHLEMYQGNKWTRLPGMTSHVVNMLGSEYATTLFYPCLIFPERYDGDAYPLRYEDSPNKPVTFNIFKMSRWTGDDHNNEVVRGVFTGGGSSDTGGSEWPHHELYIDRFQEAEHSVLKICRGSNACMAICLYLRGGYLYHLETDGTGVQYSSQSISSGDSVFSVKDASDVNQPDVDGGPVINSVQVTSNTPVLGKPSGKYFSTDVNIAGGLSFSQPVGEISTSGNSVGTSLDVSTWTKVEFGSITANPRNNKFTGTVNRLTYTGSTNRTFHISASATFYPNDSTERQYVFSLYKNGSIVPNCLVYERSPGFFEYHSISINMLVDMSTNDYIELWVYNSGGTSTVLTVPVFNMFAIATGLTWNE